MELWLAISTNNNFQLSSFQETVDFVSSLANTVGVVQNKGPSRSGFNHREQAIHVRLNQVVEGRVSRGLSARSGVDVEIALLSARTDVHSDVTDTELDTSSGTSRGSSRGGNSEINSWCSVVEGEFEIVVSVS